IARPIHRGHRARHGGLEPTPCDTGHRFHEFSEPRAEPIAPDSSLRECRQASLVLGFLVVAREHYRAAVAVVARSSDDSGDFVAPDQRMAVSTVAGFNGQGRGDARSEGRRLLAASVTISPPVVESPRAGNGPRCRNASFSNVIVRRNPRRAATKEQPCNT